MLNFIIGSIISFFVFDLNLTVLAYKSCKYEDWTLHKGICYKHVPFPNNEAIFAKAHGNCQEILGMGSSLVMPKTKEQFNFLKKSYIYLQTLWLGMSYVNDHWVWIDQSEVNISAEWFTASQNQSEILQYGKCVVITVEKDDRWRMMDCEKESKVLCQMKAIETVERRRDHHDCKEICCDQDNTGSTNPNTSTVVFNVNDLKVDKSTLSSYIRGRTSASDDRKSSVCMGWFGILLICCIVGSIVSLDMMPPRRINMKYLYRIRRRLSHRLKNIK